MTAPARALAAEHSPYVHGERIERVVARHAERDPGALAVRQGAETLRYGELTGLAGSVAAGLRARGVGPGGYVPVLMARSPEFVAVLLGVLAAGAAYIAMDPAWPHERTADAVRRCGAPLVVGDRPGTEVGGSPVVAWTALVSGADGPPPPPYSDGTEAACVFYTSGSTGRPKGVLSPHRGTVRTLVGCPEIPLASDTVFLQAAPQPWDAFSLELWGPLLNGGSAVLLDRGAPALDADGLRRALGHGVNTLWLTSSLFNVLVEEVPELVGAARLVLVGGERVSVRHARQLLDRFPRLRLVNGYGPVESTIFATCHPVRPSDVAPDSTEIPIGRPVPRTGVVLLGPEGEVRTGPGDGEIALSGDGLSLGYLGDAEETARRFVTLDGVRHYRTGDLATRDADGLLRYRGRADQQFKVRGVRVEPGEVEAVLERHPDVASCCAVLAETAPDRPGLAVLYTTVSGAPVPDEELRSIAARTLLDAMVPAVLTHTAQLPLGATGKADRAAAARLITDTLTAARPAPARPGPEAPELLTAAAQLLGAPALREDDDVIAAGATSLDVVRLAARSSRLLRARITVADVYRLRSVAALRGHGATAPPADTGVPLEPEPEPASAPGPLPLTRAQQRFWMAEGAAPGAADNALVLAYVLDGPLDTEALHRALHDVVVRHPVLRTVHPWRDELPEQRVRPAALVRVPLERVPRPAGAEAAQAARAVTEDWWRLPFRLEEDLPIRARLCELGPARHLLCLHLHHIAFDGWSESVLLRDLGLFYSWHTGSGPEDGPPPAPGYPDYARWEHRHLPRRIEEELPFWEQELAQLPTPVLPAPTGEGEAPAAESAGYVPRDMVERLTRASALRGGPAVAGLVAAVGRGLARTFDAADVTVGTVTDGRFAPELEPVVGYFVNPLVVPVRGARDAPDATLLDQVARTVVTGLAHGRVPFDELVRRLAPPRDRHPFFQVWSVVQRRPPHGRFAPGLTVRSVRVPAPATARELTVEAVPDVRGGWRLNTQWRVDGLDDATAAALAGEVLCSVEELAALD
ncbi:amino acid adenylation domain-containing protein [Streptomyces sp. NPDC044780]|uniref:amino acid adenylation domain-containing protein n=1 Tax=unclassified Streptomyces TaxID=2593676 RepID=UPI0033F4C6BA